MAQRQRRDAETNAVPGGLSITFQQLTIRSRPLLAAAGVALLAAAVAPSEGRAGPIGDLQNQIAADQAKLSQIAARTSSIESEMGSNQAKIGQLQTLLAQINASLTAVNAHLSQNRAKLNQLVAEEKRVTGQLQATEQELARRQAIFDSDVRTLDKIAPTDQLTVLFGSTSFADFLDRLMSMSQLVQGDHVIAAQLKVERERISALRNELDSQRRQQQQVVNAIHAQQVVLQQEYAVQSAASAQLWGLQAQLGQTRTNLIAQRGTLNGQIRQDQAEIQSLLAFAQGRAGSGGDIVAPEYLGDGWGQYYNQRDARWGNLYMGVSSYQVWEVGCLMTDVAMVYTHFGFGGVTPATLASNPNNFTSDGYLYNFALNVPGHSATQVWGPSTRWINSYLDSGGVVIVGMDIGGGTHFVTLKSRNGAYDYWINDPWAQDAMNVSFDNSPDTGPIFEAIGYH
ncbi:MAG: PcsB-like coiled-coil domain-containing protein [Candidatus Dormibacterales bacterium]